MTRRPRRQPSLSRFWWRGLAWTVAAIACLNLLLGYLVARALLPAPFLVQPMVLGVVGLLGLACGLAAFVSWRSYLRARRASAGADRE